MMEQMAAFVVKLISDSIRYFREEAGDAAYADALMERTRPIVANLQRRPFQLGCGAEQMGYISDDPAFAGKHEQTCCKVMDGRILHGICEWHSVYLDRHGIPSDWKDQWPMGRVLSFALVAAKHTMTTRGWYDDQCLGEGGCHTICGAMNILGGLLAARRLAQRYEPLGNPAIVCFFQTRRNCLLQFDAAIKVAIDFLIATQAVVTNTRFWVTPGSWGIGYLYEALAEAATLFPGHPGISDWLNTLREYSKVMDFPTKRLTGFHRLNALIPLAHACPEFNQTPAKP